MEIETWNQGNCRWVEKMEDKGSGRGRSVEMRMRATPRTCYGDEAWRCGERTVGGYTELWSEGLLRTP